MTRPLRVAIAGLGTVGGGVVKVLTARRAEIAARAGREVDCVLVSARDHNKKRGADIGALAWTDDSASLATSDADVVVELIGGEDGIARTLVENALKSGKHVVTANKALLAYHGAELAELAEEKGVVLRFEGAAAGGIPIVKALRESLIAYDIVAVKGILNGTCNYILTQMEATGRPFADILADAQKLGFAEADPTLDVGGGDTAHKLALLASLAFGIKPDLGNIPIQGISHITPEDIAFAREFGCRIKLLGSARRIGDRIDQRVQPAMVRLGTPLADVDGAFNAVVANAREAGPFFFEGRGAGEAPTASAVVADIVDIARGNASPVFGRPAHSLRAAVPALSHTLRAAFYLRFDVLDVPGVLAEIATHLAQSEISIESMIQRGRSPRGPVSIVMITHECSHEAVARALKVIAASDRVLGSPCMIPMEAG
jgi:homoserine dehydrogenase